MKKIFLIHIGIFIILINTTLELLLDQIPAISTNYIQTLKKSCKFKVFDIKNHPFKKYSIKDMKKHLGVNDIDPARYRISKRTSKVAPDNISLFGSSSSKTQTTSINPTKNIFFSASDLAFEIAKLPNDYLVTKNYPKCGSFVKDQGICSSCWALAVTEVLADRICIKTNMEKIVTLSSQLLVSCDTQNYGCSGGHLNTPWIYLKNNGVVTEQCLPYVSGISGFNEICVSNCIDGSKFIIHKSLDYKEFKNSDEMKLEIHKNGPIMTGFAVYADFFSYSGGVYNLTPGSTFLGGHAVKVIGWGRDLNGEFWIAKNTWGSAWGENGFFRFKMNHCCSFDINGIAALPLL